MSPVVPRLLAVLAIMLGSIYGFSPAQAAESASFQALSSQGFEVRSVDVVSTEIAKSMDGSVTYPTVMVTLQKGQNMAVCYFSLSNWLMLNEGSMVDVSRCFMR